MNYSIFISIIRERLKAAIDSAELSREELSGELAFFFFQLPCVTDWISFWIFLQCKLNTTISSYNKKVINFTEILFWVTTVLQVEPVIYIRWGQNLITHTVCFHSHPVLLYLADTFRCISSFSDVGCKWRQRNFNDGLIHLINKTRIYSFLLF